MVNVKQASFCPNCHVEVEASVVSSCPTCGKILKALPSKHFELPYYFSLQLKDLQDKFDTSLRDPEAKQPTAAETKEFEEAKKGFKAWIRSMPTEERLGALRDAHLVMLNLVQSRIDEQDLVQILAIAESIGKVADSVKLLLKNGGALEPETRDVPAVDGDSYRSAAATPRSWDTLRVDP
jgi:hypothetical protein